MEMARGGLAHHGGIRIVRGRVVGSFVGRGLPKAQRCCGIRGQWLARTSGNPVISLCAATCKANPGAPLDLRPPSSAAMCLPLHATAELDARSHGQVRIEGRPYRNGVVPGCSRVGRVLREEFSPAAPAQAIGNSGS